MLKDVLNWLSSDSTQPLPEPDAHLAMAALLVRLARSDGDYAEVEMDKISDLLAQKYGLSDSEALQLREDAEALEADAPDTVRFTRAIKDGVSYEERSTVIETLWELVLADGDRNHEEDGLIRLVAPLLGVNDRDSALARQRVVERIG
ncbi:MAG: TerB family tellurite resistance protein [Pseudomonadota bacterium]